MLSFRKIKIVKKFTNDIKLSIKRSKTNVNDFSKQKINNKISEICENEIDESENKIYESEINESKICENEINESKICENEIDESEIDKNSVIDKHYIGLIFTNSTSMNSIYNLKWNNKNLLYLNSTNIYLCNNKNYLITELNDTEITKKFKYKKYIKKYINEKYSIKPSDIITIKLYETFNNLHNYIIILKNVDILNNGKNSVITDGKAYAWRTLFSSFNIDIIDIEPSQNKIYNLILKNDNEIDYIFSPQFLDNYPLYFKKYNIKLSRLKQIFSTIKF